MAECHPVGFQWVMEAKARGAKVIHVDPRFTRTSAVADTHVPIRAGSDIVFLGAVINYILSNEKYFREYVVAYTNAATLVSEDFRDVDDLDGVFSGYDPETGTYDTASWAYEGVGQPGPATPGGSGRRRPRQDAVRDRARRPRARRPRRRARAHRGPARRDAAAPAVRVPGAQAALRPLHPGDGPGGLRRRPRAVARRLRGGHRQQRPGADDLLGLLGRLDPPHGGRAVHPRRRRSSSCCWATWAGPAAASWRCAGHASIQGSTDIPTLFNLLPGYLPMPRAGPHDSLDDYVGRDRQPGPEGLLDQRAERTRSAC